MNFQKNAVGWGLGNKKAVSDVLTAL
jgi:hypothetical protein